MQVLTKLDPCITKNLYSSTFSSIFEHDEATSQWLSLKFEGSLYILERQPPSPPSTNQVPVTYCLFLLNRQRRENYVQDLRADMDFRRVK